MPYWEGGRAAAGLQPSTAAAPAALHTCACASTPPSAAQSSSAALQPWPSEGHMEWPASPSSSAAGPAREEQRLLRPPSLAGAATSCSAMGS
jgi:hypothetical protein